VLEGVLQRAGGLASVIFLCVLGLVAAMGEYSITSTRQQGVSEKAGMRNSMPFVCCCKDR
jgi:hypothetical protein